VRHRRSNGANLGARVVNDYIMTFNPSSFASSPGIDGVALCSTISRSICYKAGYRESETGSRRGLTRVQAGETDQAAHLKTFCSLSSSRVYVLWRLYFFST
jgi:hypothetical protein